MTEKCRLARENIFQLAKILKKEMTQEAYHNYIQATADFQYRFKKRFDPHNLIDDYVDDYVLWTPKYQECV